MNAWIFQGNTNYFRITEYLDACADIIWEAKQKKQLMEVGDIVYMWRADSGNPGTGGVIARGTMTTLPQFRDDVDAKEFYVAEFKARAQIKGWRVEIHIDEHYLNRPVLTRLKAQNDLVLRHMHIMTVRSGTNFVLKPGEAGRLAEIIREAEERDRP